MRRVASISNPSKTKVGIDKNVTIIGEGDHIEIWDSQALESYMDSIDPFGDFLED